MSDCLRVFLRGGDGGKTIGGRCVAAAGSRPVAREAIVCTVTRWDRERGEGCCDGVNWSAAAGGEGWVSSDCSEEPRLTGCAAARSGGVFSEMRKLHNWCVARQVVQDISVAALD